MHIDRTLFGERGLYDHNVTIIRDVGGCIKVVKLKTVRKKGLETDVKAKKNTEDIAEKVKHEAAISRSKRMVKEYALCNDWDWFVTLTISKEHYDRYDLKGYQKALHDFLHNYNRRCDEVDKVRYVFIPEMHEDGAWHMHGLVKGIRPKDLQPNGNGYLEWAQYAAKFGYMSLGAIKDKNRVANYITKYITKSMARSVSEYGANMYYCSKGLKTGEVIFRGHNFDMDCDWDYERPDGFCKVKWFDDEDSFNEHATISMFVGVAKPYDESGEDELTSNLDSNCSMNISTSGCQTLTKRNGKSLVQYAQKRGCSFYVTSYGRWSLKNKPLSASMKT